MVWEGILWIVIERIWTGNIKVMITSYLLFIPSYDHVIQLDKKSKLAWNNKGVALKELSRY